MKRLLLAATTVALTLSACGSSEDVAYQPAAWGPYGYCYYLYSPYECYGHHSGVPVLMPVWWHQRYAGYYDSPAYVGVYVPSRYRSTATTRARVFERTYSSQIKTASRAATWKGSNGKTVSGTKVGRSATYGGGAARSSGFSGGSVRSRPCGYVPSDRPYFVAGSSFSGGGARSSGSSFSSGGGARSSGGSSSRPSSGGSRSSGSSKSYGRPC